MIAERLRSRAPEPVKCTGCGAAYRAAYTWGRCPICDRESSMVCARPRVRAFGALGATLRERWAIALLCGGIVANVAILIVVSVSSR